MTVGVPCTTVNPLRSVTDSLPVVTITLRGPAAAPAAIAIGTEASVGPLTVTVPTLMPAPKNAVVTWGVKLVKAPFSITVRLVPWIAETGLIENSVGCPGVTVKPPTSWATSAPVVRTTVRAPSAAPGRDRDVDRRVGCVDDGDRMLP